MMSDIDRVKQAYLEVLLPLDPNARVEVEAGASDYLHVIAVSSAFEGQKTTKRNQVNREAIRRLGMIFAMRITVVLLLTPQEHEQMQEEAVAFA